MSPPLTYKGVTLSSLHPRLPLLPLQLPIQELFQPPGCHRTGHEERQVCVDMCVLVRVSVFCVCLSSEQNIKN